MTPILKLFENSYAIYKDKFKILTKLALFNVVAFLVFLPFVIAFIVAAGYSYFNYKTNFAAALTTGLVGTLFLLVGILIAIIFGLVVFVSTYVAIKEGNNQSKVKEMMSKAWLKAGSFFWVSLLVGLATMGGFILFIIPGIIFCVWFSQALFVFVFEDVKGVQALKRSKALVEGKFWKVFGRLLLLAVVGGLISSIKGVGPFINMLFFAPFSIVYSYLVYQDLKNEKL